MTILKIATSRLSIGSQGDDVSRLHRAFRELGMQVPAGERVPSVLGDGTVAVVKALQEEAGIPATGGVDATTVAVINRKLASLATEPRVVRGVVRSGSGDAANALTVVAYLHGPSGEVALGRAETTTDGSYSITYRRPDAIPVELPLDLRLQVVRTVANAVAPLPPEILDTTPTSKNVLLDAGVLEVVDFVLGPSAVPLKSEYEQLLSDTALHLGSRVLSRLVEDDTHHDISLLAAQIGRSSEQVAALVRAHRLAQGTAVPPEVLFALLRQGLPADGRGLQAVHPKVRAQALKTSVERGLAPAAVNGKKLEDFLDGFSKVDPTPLRSVLGLVVPNTNEQDQVVALYEKSARNAESFWEAISADPGLAPRAAELRLTLQIASLVNMHEPLVKAVKALPEIRQASDLASVTEAKWKALIETPSLDVPTDTPGNTPDEKRDTYTRTILRQVEAAFPTPFLAERLPVAHARIKSFLRDSESLPEPYDLFSTYPARFFADNPSAAASLSDDEKQQLLGYQRIHRLTQGAAETLALAEFHSAGQIARMDRDSFTTKLANTLSQERAREIHDRASRTHALALALYAERSADMGRTSTMAFEHTDPGTVVSQSIGNWDTLFGTFELCTCAECASAHGPAAYFVDALRFLGDLSGTPGGTVRDDLFKRRADLGDIELSCENTNTPVPTIDLVNEILEDTVVSPLPFAPFTLDPALEHELGLDEISSALATASQALFRAGSPIELITPGQRWRIWESNFAYTVTKDNGTLTVDSRSRQTTGSAAERRAQPQYRNGEVYDNVLSTAVNPWTLPFNLRASEADVFLRHLGLARRDLIEAVAPTPLSPAVGAAAAAEALGLTDTERRIIVGTHPGDNWAPTVFAQPIKMRDLLDRTGLRFADLASALDAWFVRASGFVSILGPADSCDTNELTVAGLDQDAFDRLHRFVRLWRTLGWSLADVDSVLNCLAADPNATPVLDDDTLVRLDHLKIIATRLRLRIREVLPFWTTIDTSRTESLYGSLFRQPSAGTRQDPAFQLRGDGSELADDSQSLNDHVAAVQAALRLDAASLALLVQGLVVTGSLPPDPRLNLRNLSVLYRHAVLARQLSLTVGDLLTVLELTGLNPFESSASKQGVHLLDVVRDIKAAGFSIAELDYLLRNRASVPAPFVPTDAELGSTLNDLRADLRAISPTGPERSVLQRSAVIDRISGALGLSGDAAASLMEGTNDGFAPVTDAGKTALAHFIELADIPEPPPPAANTPPSATPIAPVVPVVTRTNAGVQFQILETLLRIASVAQRLALPTGQFAWLFRAGEWLGVVHAHGAVSQPPSLESWLPLLQVPMLRREFKVTEGALEAILTVLTRVARASSPQEQVTAKQDFVAALNTWLGWSTDDVVSLVGNADHVADSGLLKVTLPDQYRLDTILRIGRAVAIAKRGGVPVSEIVGWAKPEVFTPVAVASPPTDAPSPGAVVASIRAAAKAKYDEKAWRTVITPLHDELRDRQREALVSYLSAQPLLWTSTAVGADSKALFDHFLIDVEMTSAQSTSRIKQAIGSVQLFVQRCLLGLEGIVTDASEWKQWEWMKNFRVWEANRKVWLYPENWIEPELRENKSPFFKELENDLMQSDLDNAAAEQALMRYLEKLDAVSRLQIVGVYEDDENKVLHVFGRTYNTPHTYNYRRREGMTQAWTAWEKVDLDITGDHLIPVVWNQKLMLIWPVFTLKQKETRSFDMPGPKEPVTQAERYWDIQLAWSEFQYGRWSGKRLSSPVPLYASGEFSSAQQVPNVMFMLPEGSPHGPGKDLPRPDPVFENVQIDDAEPSPHDAGDPISPTRISFKALLSKAAPERLSVLGYLRNTDSALGGGVAYPFGEFRFSSCRNIVSVGLAKDLPLANFALAPTGTRFEGTRFSSVRSQPDLTLFDGTFPVYTGDLTGRNPGPTRDEKIDIPVLGSVPGGFALQAPHQDLQFGGDRPFFFQDRRRALLVTSQGKSGRRRRLDTMWGGADLATLARDDYFGESLPPATPQPTAAEASLTVLARTVDGARVPRSMTRVESGAFIAKTVVPTFWSTRTYTFLNFHHPYTCEFVSGLAAGGVSRLLSRETQELTESPVHSFEQTYDPDTTVATPYPVEQIDFDAGGAYEQYNWELFFHIPLLIATRLGQNQRFEAAQRWFHYIFDPAGRVGLQSSATATAPPADRYWPFKPFAALPLLSVQDIEKMAAGEAPPSWLCVAIEEWRTNPFSPHAIARLRIAAYAKTVVMKYLDNLIAWGDQLFRANTLETINEATLLYVLASEILGRRPEGIPPRHKPPVKTFRTLAHVGLLGNALEQIELLIGSSGESVATSTGNDAALPSEGILHFCVPENAKLLGYWDTVADRLFKIRHSMTIEGQVQQLQLFEPAIDPALLVRARAAGLSMSEVLQAIDVSLPHYRFSVMVQKANEVIGEVKSLGAALLAALEKRDAEALSTLRSGQELRLLQSVRDVRVRQVEEAKASHEALLQSQAIVQARKDYYESRPFLNTGEGIGLVTSTAAQLLQVAKGSSEAISIPLSLLPDSKAGTPTTIGITFGGSNVAESQEAHTDYLGTLIEMSLLAGGTATRLGEYQRRQDEWDHQAGLATTELKQIDKQLLATEIRMAMAEQELRNHDQQIDNGRETDDFLRNKFTNQDLFQWTIGRVSSLYFQSYQLAFDLARRAEKCMQHELGVPYGSTSVVQFGAWDSLKKGLLAGEQLAHNVKRLEISYLDGHKREHELTKHVSLLALNPSQLIELKTSGTCSFETPEWLFDLDTPGHYMRRLRMVSVTIPCVTGPYTSVHCKLVLTSSRYRRSAVLNPGYAWKGPGDDRFVEDRRVINEIVTSTGQNDAGLFEPTMRDERYLPFEGAGAVSTWRLELPTEFKLFDYASIADVILHLRYTSRSDDSLLVPARDLAKKLLASDEGPGPLFRFISLRHEFPTEWHRFVSAPANAAAPPALTVAVELDRLPYFLQGRQVRMHAAKVVGETRSGQPAQFAIAPGQLPPSNLGQNEWTGPNPVEPGSWTVATDADPAQVKDVFVVLSYTAS